MFVIRTGTQRRIIEVVGGRKNVIIGTENKDNPIPTVPLIIPPIKTDKKIMISILKSR